MKETTSPRGSYLQSNFWSCLRKPFGLPPYMVLGVILLSVLTLFLVFPFRHSKNGGATTVSSQGLRQAPKFALENAEGKKIALKDFRGRYVILHFWAGWCAPCLAEISEWVERAHTSKGLPIQWVAVSLDQSWQDVHKILPSDSTPDFISLLDSGLYSGAEINSQKNIADRYGTFQFPETYLLSPDQKILKKWVGPQDWNGPQMDDFLKRLSL